MVEGSADRSGFVFHTDSFNKDEVELLVSVLKKKNKWFLNCSIHTWDDRIKRAYLIYIKKYSFNKFKTLLEPYIIPPPIFHIN